MSDYFGDIRLGDTIDIKFTTRQISGAPFTLSGGTIVAYPGNSTTEVTGGITLSADFDSRTGYNNVRIVASNGNGYATGTNYDLCISAGTVNSVSVVGESIGSFSIENRSALMPATAARTLVVDAAGLADANMVKLGPTGSGTAQTARDIGTSVLLSSGTGTGQISLSSGLVSLSGTQTFNLTGNITGNLSGSVGSVTGNVGGNVTGSVGSISGVSFPSNFSALAITAGGIAKADLQAVLASAVTEGGAGRLAAAFTKLFDVASPVLTATSVNQTGDNYARLGAPAGASVSADIAAVKVDTAAVKVKTDQFVFTIANQIDANALTLNTTMRAGIRKNVALAKFEFLMTDSTNHNPATGLTCAVTRSIDGGAFAAGTLSAVTEVSAGVYYVDFGAGDLNGEVVTLRVTATGADDLVVTIVTDP